MKPLTRREFFLALIAPVVAFFVTFIPPKPKKKLALARYKGSSPYDAGFFYAPYIPLQYVRMPGGEAMKYDMPMKYECKSPYYRMVKI